MSTCWRGRLGVGICLVALFLGCGGRDPSGRRMVSGTVTLDGTPLKTGSISFEPTGETRVGSGAVITEGKYRIDSDHGLTVGKYRVLISAAGERITEPQNPAMPGATRNVPREIIPPEYNVRSDKTVEITGQEPCVFDFDIISQKKENRR